MTPEGWKGQERREFPYQICERHDKTINEIHKSLHGNGDPTKGIWYIADQNNKAINEIKGFIDSVKKWLWWLVSIGVVASLSQIWEAVKSFIQHS